MKKFQFSLETVLSYKNQVLSALQGEHAVLLAKVHKQEELVKALQEQALAYAQEYREKKQEGLSILDAMEYERGLETLERQLQKEQKILETRKAEAEKKRAEVVAARQESMSIEKLKEKKLVDYQKDLQKDEEKRVEEFVSSTRNRTANA